MHEMSLFKDLLEKIGTISDAHPGKKIVRLDIKLGALSHLSSSHFREHFTVFSKGTSAEGAELYIEEGTDQNAPDAQDVVLQSVEIET